MLYISQSEVTVICELTDDYPEASCVLVYREYNGPYLTVEEYNRSTEFPVTISVDNTERYTFAVFGKNGVDGIEPDPVVLLKNKSYVMYPQPETRKLYKMLKDVGMTVPKSRNNAICRQQN